MNNKNSDETPTPETIEYHNHEDRRRRQKERLLNAPHYDPQFSEPSKLHGKHNQPHIQFRVSPFAARVGSEVAALFNMSLSQYTKALLYLNLGLVFEPVDRRRKKRK